MTSEERPLGFGRLRTLFEAGTLGGLADGQLLKRFAARDGAAAEAAFALLVERHGAMVLRVCRSILADTHAADDAFQASFLVLAQKAGSLRARDDIGPWLYQVAYRVSSCARSAAARRRRHEQAAAEKRAGATRAETPEDVGPIVHEEVNALPDRYRAAVVLCCLEGRTHAEAARRLGCPVGTVESRLARGRERLRVRLARRGLSPSLIPVAAPFQAPLPVALVDSTVGLASMLAAGRAEGAAVVLLKQVLGDMLMTRLKLSLAALGSVAVLSAAVLTLQPKGVAGPPEPKAEIKAPEAVAAVEQAPDGPLRVPKELNFGTLRVGALADGGATLILNETNESGKLNVEVNPPSFLKVRGVQIRQQTRLGKKTRLVELRLAVDTSRPGDFKGTVHIDYDGRRFEFPATVSVLPEEKDLTKVLFITPSFGSAADDREYFQPWFDLIKSANLDVSYLDPTLEGLPDRGRVEYDRDARPIPPEWLKRFDVVLLADGGPVYVQGPDSEILRSYVRGGGRLVIGASAFMLGSVPKMNDLLEPFGLQITDRDVVERSDPSGPNWVPITVKAAPDASDPFLKNVNTIVFSRMTPVRVKDDGRARILIHDPHDKDLGFAAVSRDGGEVIVLGPSLLLNWLGENQAGTDNVAFLGNLLRRPKGR
ncbi:RNA polymerase sigma factor [Paludisphaera rhizosphaerae]|uniref:RNA polymerase sigma factor n=1 Tax=Paludisphaera rhizosphaerae TaxID=2711216 RepID=UPI0013ECEBE5|nr:RNA polymerase sigma factor [Paludisphaera rhizosphaerae]